MRSQFFHLVLKGNHQKSFLELDKMRSLLKRREWRSDRCFRDVGGAIIL
jgi:hypothetical protein